jgi:uncharacterized membrane-anchored protein
MKRDGRPSAGQAEKGMMRAILAAATIALVAGGASLSFADGMGPRQTKKQAAAAKAAAAPASYGQTGAITLPGGINLVVPATYYYVGPQEAQNHLRRIGAPQPPGQVLGMVAPASARAIDDGFWGAVISSNPLGHVAEERKEVLTAPTFPDEVRDARKTTAPAAPRLESFAVQPAYNASAKRASWVERTAGPATARTVRSEQRLLGRDTVVGVTIDARADQLGAITNAAPDIANMISFPAGKTYADYAASDPPPQYDLPSLVTLKAKPATSTTVVAEPATTPAPAPATTGSVAKGIPAQSKGLQPVGAAGADGATPPPAFAASDLQPWLPWIGGGLIALAVIPWLVGMARRRQAAAPNDRPGRNRAGDEPPPADPNLTPSDT